MLFLPSPTTRVGSGNWYHLPEHQQWYSVKASHNYNNNWHNKHQHVVFGMRLKLRHLHTNFILVTYKFSHILTYHWGWRTPLFPLVHLFSHLFPFYYSLSFIGFTYFLLLSILSLSTRIIPLRFQAGGRRRRPNLGLVCCVYFICVICIP